VRQPSLGSEWRNRPTVAGLFVNHPARVFREQVLADIVTILDGQVERMKTLRFETDMTIVNLTHDIIVLDFTLHFCNVRETNGILYHLLLSSLCFRHAIGGKG
jgi:hypothetical protein